MAAALIFMLAHFLKIPESLDQEPVHLWSGASAVGAAFLPVLHGDFLGGRGLNLFLIGLILGGIFLRAGSLWINAGLHGGWIFALLLFSGMYPAGHAAASSLFWAADLLSSPLTSLVLILLSAYGYGVSIRHPPPRPSLGRMRPEPRLSLAGKRGGANRTRSRRLSAASAAIPFPRWKITPTLSSATIARSTTGISTGPAPAYRTDGQVHEAIIGFKYRDEYLPARAIWSSG